MTTCPAVVRHGQHSVVIVYRRHRVRFWRKAVLVRCWQCDLAVEDPFR